MFVPGILKNSLDLNTVNTVSKRWIYVKSAAQSWIKYDNVYRILNKWSNKKTSTHVLMKSVNMY